MILITSSISMKKTVRTDPLILLTAYNGTAAFIIDGITLHSALCLPTSGTENHHMKKSTHYKHDYTNLSYL